MTGEDKLRAKALRLQETTTQENLETWFSTVIRYGNRILMAGYYHGAGYYAAAYTFTTEDKTCEGEIRLTAVSKAQFEDEGHAIEWAIRA